LQQWVGTRRPVVAALFGAALYALAFFEPLPLVTGILFAALLLRAIMRGTISWREVTFHGVVALAAFGLTYVIVRVGTGFDLVQAFREITAHALAFNRSTGRPYSIWVRQNLWDIAFGMGVCQAVLIPVALGDSLMESYHTRQLTPAAVVTTALLVVLVLIDLLGVNRGEVVRLWIFLACLLQIPAAYVCFRLKSRLAIAIVIACTLIESALGTAMIGFVLPV